MENGKAFTIKKRFSRTTQITKYYEASPQALWKILVEGNKYPDWNSTIIFFEGDIVQGGTIKLKSYLDEKRIFKLNVKEVDDNSKLVWGDAMGNRTFTLTPNNTGTVFTMKETIGGPLFPIFSRMIPSFDESFERFANDLEKAIAKN